MRANLKIRGTDRHGAGYFGAPRKGRKHKGVDYVVPVGAEILSPVAGKITKIGYPYADDLSFRYVEVTSDGLRHRCFYIFPKVELGQEVAVDDVLGVAQSLGQRYRGITGHCHYEVLDSDGKAIDPASIL